MDMNMNATYPPANLDRYAIHDPIWAPALAMKQNGTTAVAVDVVGLFINETAEVKKLLPPDLDITDMRSP